MNELSDLTSKYMIIEKDSNSARQDRTWHRNIRGGGRHVVFRIKLVSTNYVQSSAQPLFYFITLHGSILVLRVISALSTQYYFVPADLYVH